MSKFIHNLKQKTDAQKKRFALLCSVAITGLALVAFAFAFFAEYHDYADSRTEAAKKEGTLSKISKSYNEYKKSFDESPLAQQMEDAQFVQKDVSSSTATSTTTTAGMTASTTSASSSANRTTN